MGLVSDLTGNVVLDPDEEVQAAVRLVFALFEQYGSALAVVKHFTVHHLRFPERLWQRTRKGALVDIEDRDAPVCFECGSLMVRNGACYKCLNCGSTSGCS